MPMVRKMKKEKNELFLNLEKKGWNPRSNTNIVNKKVVSYVKRIKWDDKLIFFKKTRFKIFR